MPQNWRNTDPDTSREAGISTSFFIKEHHRLILDALTQVRNPLAAEEIGDITGLTHVAVGKRMLELVREGLVYETEQRHVNRSGRSAIKYALASLEPSEHHTMNQMTIQPIDICKRVEQYVKLRDHIKALKEEHKAQLKPYNEALEGLNQLLLSHLNAINADRAATEAGTVYVTPENHATIADKEAFWNFVMETGNRALADIRANVIAVKDLLDEGRVVPGVNFSSRNVVGVRRKS